MKDNKDKLENEYKDNKKRKIEFRGKRVDNGEWVYGLPMYMNYIKEFTEHEWIDELDNNRVKKYQTSADFQIEGETLGQFTGLCDKNGKKIYEGDIVKLTRTNMYVPSASFNGKDLVSLHRVCWNDEKHCFYQEHFDIDKKRVTGAGMLCFEDERAKENIIEVIGNIYDNPELLGG